MKTASRRSAAPTARAQAGRRSARRLPLAAAPIVTDLFHIVAQAAQLGGDERSVIDRVAALLRLTAARIHGSPVRVDERFLGERSLCACEAPSW